MLPICARAIDGFKANALARRTLDSLLALAFLAICFGQPAKAEDLAQLLAKADVENGQAIALRCKACHTLDKGGRHVLGPNLWNIVGRAIGRTEGFTRYSPGMTEKKGDWDLTKLNAFLASPKAWLPDTRMAFPGVPDQADRADLLAFLRTLNDKPVQQAAASPQRPTTGSRPRRSSAIDLGGMPEDEGSETTAVICSACHSLKTVTQQGLPADRWDELMDWMAEKQGMAPLDEASRKQIVGYLAKYYGPDRKALGGGGSTINPMAPAMPMMRSPMAPLAPPLPPEPKN
jgi:cytochrome c